MCRHKRDGLSGASESGEIIDFDNSEREQESHKNIIFFIFFSLPQWKFVDGANLIIELISALL